MTSPDYRRLGEALARRTRSRQKLPLRVRDREAVRRIVAHLLERGAK